MATGWRHRDDGPVAATIMARAVAPADAPPRLAWLTPAVLRAVEYGLVVGAAWAAGAGAAPPAAYGLIAVVAFHHYDGEYRMRFWGQTVPRWVDWLGLGWDGRSAVVVAAWAVGALTPVLVVLAVWCGVLFVGESVAWLVGAGPPRAGSGVTDSEGRLR